MKYDYLVLNSLIGFLSILSTTKMFRFNSVSMFLILLSLDYGHSLNLVKDDFYAIFGTARLPYGKLFVFDDFGVGRIKFDIGYVELKAPELLDCEKYRIIFQPTSINTGASSIDGRVMMTIVIITRPSSRPLQFSNMEE